MSHTGMIAFSVKHMRKTFGSFQNLPEVEPQVITPKDVV